MKCDACGRFISYQDLESGKATRTMTAPDSQFGPEDWETLCRDCNKEEPFDGRFDRDPETDLPEPWTRDWYASQDQDEGGFPIF